MRISALVHQFGWKLQAINECVYQVDYSIQSALVDSEFTTVKHVACLESTWTVSGVVVN